MQEELLKALSLKKTKPRCLVLRVLEEAHSPLPAKEILRLAQKLESIDLSSVYRTLTLFTEKKIVQKTLWQDGQAYYEFTGFKHRHHLICVVCNETIELDQCPLQNLSQTLHRSTGYQITGHSMEFFGICPKCAKNQETE